MGNGYGGWYKPGAPKKEGTTLIELTIKNISDAHDIVGERPEGVYTPVTLCPRKSHQTCCFLPACWISIPSGFSAIVSKFGAVVEGDEEDGTWSPGWHCFSPLYNVDKMVSKQLIIFDTPVKGCKTKDAITVHIDVLIVFEIFRARDFVYSIGPEKFDDLLRASQDEALRQMANETLVENIYDLHGASTAHIITDLNTKFEKYGVKVHHFTVKNVTIPADMAQDFEDKTLFDSKTTMKHMKQESDRLKLNNEEGKQKLQEECENTKQAAEQQTEIVKSQAIKETAEVLAETSRNIGKLEADLDVEVQQLLAQAELEVSKIKAQVLAHEREIKSKTSANCGRISAEASAYKKEKQAEASIEVAQKLASGKKALGEAEGVAAGAFAARRAHEAELKRLDILEQVCKNEGIQIATSQENTVSMNQENAALTQVAQQGLEALRAKLAELTATSLVKLDQVKKEEAKKPKQETMKRSSQHDEAASSGEAARRSSQRDAPSRPSGRDDAPA